jgi:MFS family permease
MAQISGTGNVIDTSDAYGTPLHAKRLFYGCFASMFATSFGFIVRALLLNDFGRIFNLTEAQKGAIQGAGLFPFAISIILFSLFIDRTGYGRIMVLAFIGHVGGTIMMIFAKNYEMLYMGTLVLALANGAIEAVVNPVTATIFPTKKTHYLNILHAGWPGGLVLGGVIAILMGDVAWQWKVGLVLIPTVIYGIMLVGQRFPIQERVAAGVSYADMMREFGAAGALLITYFLVQALSTVLQVIHLPQISQTIALIVAVVVAIGFFAVYKSIGRPMFVFLLLIMILLATTELGVDSWVTSLMEPVFGKHAGWILVYTSAIMFVLRFFAGPIVHRISPLGLLCVCAALAAVGLVSLSMAATGALVFLAATLYGVGKSFFWPTTLGVVSEQFPRGGALTLNAMGGMGMIAVGTLGGSFLGTMLDRGLDHKLASENKTLHDRFYTQPANNYGMSYLTPPAQQRQLLNMYDQISSDRTAIEAGAKPDADKKAKDAAADAQKDLDKLKNEGIPNHYLETAAMLNEAASKPDATPETKKEAAEALADAQKFFTGPISDADLKAIAAGMADKASDAAKKTAEETKARLRAKMTIPDSFIEDAVATSKAVGKITGEVKQGSLKMIALLPATMFVGYLILIVYFVSRGGYRVQQISGEKASGGVEGPVR